MSNDGSGYVYGVLYEGDKANKYTGQNTPQRESFKYVNAEELAVST